MKKVKKNFFLKQTPTNSMKILIIYSLLVFEWRPMMVSIVWHMAQGSKVKSQGRFWRPRTKPYKHAILLIFQIIVQSQNNISFELFSTPSKGSSIADLNIFRRAWLYIIFRLLCSERIKCIINGKFFFLKWVIIPMFKKMISTKTMSYQFICAHFLFLYLEHSPNMHTHHLYFKKNVRKCIKILIFGVLEYT